MENMDNSSFIEINNSSSYDLFGASNSDESTNAWIDRLTDSYYHDLVGISDISNNSISTTRTEYTLSDLSFEEDIHLNASKSTPQKKPSNPTTIKCPICMEFIEKDRPVSTFCGHIFCNGCLELALKRSKNCPVCNKTVILGLIHRIYVD